MALISVIIPVFNTENFLSRCIESVLAQSHSDLEILLINDGSTDHSAEILNSYARSESRISVIHHENNKGLSAARNTGLKHAQGEYVSFLDSDDWIDVTFLESMYSAASKSRSNIVNNINMVREFPTGKQEFFFFGNLPHDCSGFFPSSRLIYNIMWSSCTHLYRREFLLESDISYPVGLIYEDMYFQPAAYISTEQVNIIKGSAYHYRIRDNSICRNTDMHKRYTHYFSILELVFDAMNKKRYFESHEALLFPKNFLLPLRIRPDNALLQTMQAYYTKVLPYITKNQLLYSQEDLGIIQNILSGNIPDATACDNVLTQKNILAELRKRVRRTGMHTTISL